MAGSISLALQTIFDPVTKAPNIGGKVYFVQAGTTSDPQNAYYDQALTQALPYPYTLSDGALMPFFYLADGFIKVRVLNAKGNEVFVQDNIMVVGPSSGGGGGGGGVDPSTVFQTGDSLWLAVQGTRDGWVRDNGRTLGSATSGATERANSDCQAAFIFYWNTYPDSMCPVAGGRGANALADWSANKTIQTLDWRGYIPGGLDDMGNSAAGRYANVPVVSGAVTTAASVVGEATHTLLTAELPVITPAGTITNGAITNTVSGGIYGGASKPGFQAGGSGGEYTFNPTTIAVASSQATSTFAGTAFGSGTTHNNVQKTVLGSFFRKL